MIYKMTICQVESIDWDENGIVYVTAIIEDAVMTRHQTYYDPPEYSPALCEASFEFGIDSTLPDNENDLICFLEKLDLDWNLIDTDNY